MKVVIFNLNTPLFCTVFFKQREKGEGKEVTEQLSVGGGDRVAIYVYV